MVPHSELETRRERKATQMWTPPEFTEGGAPEVAICIRCGVLVDAERINEHVDFHERVGW